MISPISSVRNAGSPSLVRRILKSTDVILSLYERMRERGGMKKKAEREAKKKKE